MGQKTHPKGFRLISTQKHLSTWYSKKEEYSKLIEEDFFIREKINSSFKDLLTLSTITIERVTNSSTKIDSINITIKALFPKASDISKKVFANYLKNLKLNKDNYLKTIDSSKEKIKRQILSFIKKVASDLNRILRINTGKQCFIKIYFLNSIFDDALLIAKSLGAQLEKRVPFRRVLKDIIKKVELTSVKGLKVEFSGRLNGIEIARSEWKRYGKIPLHTLTADIDYAYYPINTIDGVIGIKIWLLKS